MHVYIRVYKKNGSLHVLYTSLQKHLFIVSSTFQILISICKINLIVRKIMFKKINFNFLLLGRYEGES